MFFLCLRRALDRGWPAAVLSGLGIATADGLYCTAAALGVAAAAGALLAGQHRWLTLAGGAALAVLGVRALLARPAADERSQPRSAAAGLASAYLSTLGLTITNPTTIVSFAAVFAGLG